MSRNNELQDAAEAADEARIQVEEAWLAVKEAESDYRSKHATWQAATHALAALVEPQSGPQLTSGRAS